jgi:pimeloyl-ACP methyl ester carboxylesterase
VRRLAVLAFCLALAAPGAAAAAPRSVADAPIRAVSAGESQVGYRSVGHGRPLVLIMGLSGTMDAWPPSFVDALAAKRRVIVFDNEGIRRTTAGPAPLTISRMADGTASLMRALRLKRADVLGWSMGGMVAQSLARRHPQRVRRLVFCATAPGDGNATFPNPDVLGDLTDSAAGGVFTRLFPTSTKAAERYIQQIVSYRNASPAAPAEVTQAQFGASAVWLSGGDPSGHRLGRLRVPTLVGAGGLDRVLPTPNQRYLAGRLPRGRLRLYEDSGHGFLFQHQRDFVRAVERFLR